MLIIETPIFTKLISDLLTDEDYRLLQNEVIKAPEIGSIIPGAAGLRKLRFQLGGKGKRGGGRLIYYWIVNQETLLFIYAYRKSAAADITSVQTKLLVKQTKEYLDERERISGAPGKR